MMGTRPDIAYAIGKLSWFASNPSDTYFAALNRTLFYINNTNHFYLKFIQWNKGSAINPKGYVDSDYARDRSNCWSVSGYVFFVADCTFSWHSKQQSVVATSSTEAEYIALFEATQQILWLNLMYQRFGLTLPDPIEIYCDSQLALAITGGKGVFTWQAHGEFIVTSETICPPLTHQAHGGYFLKEFLNSPTHYPPGTLWVLFKSAYDSTQWKRHGRNGWVFS